MPARPIISARCPTSKRRSNGRNAKGLPVVLWGSSYSASLVFLLANAADAKDSVKAVMAFSPGEYFNDKKMVEAAAAKVTVPVFVTSANALEEEAEAKAIVAATPSTDRLQYVPPQRHPRVVDAQRRPRIPAGADENWTAVLGVPEACLSLGTREPG